MRLLRPLPLALLFGVFGVVWIVVSDGIVSRMSRDPDTLLRLQTLKGWLFVTLATALVYWIARSAQKAERRRSEEARRIVARLEEAQRIGRVGHWVLDIETDELIWSEEIYRIFGIAPEAMEHSFEGFMSFVHPEDREEMRRVQTEALREGEPLDHVHRIVTQDGEVRWVHERGERISDGQGERLVGTVHDITDRKRTEEELRRARDELQTILEHLPAAVLRVDPELRYRYVNATWSRYTGVPREEAVGLTGEEVGLGRAEGRGPVEDAMQDAFRTGRSQGATVQLPTTLGDRWFETRLLPETSGEGEVESVLVICNDVTERRRAERERLDFYAAVENARESERARVAREIHDDLGQLLTGLRMDLSQLRTRVVSDEKALRRVQQMDELLVETIHTVRRVATELRPAVLDELGLGAALQWLCERFNDRSDTPCRLEMGEREPDLEARDLVHVFRIAQEALTNCYRHAAAAEVRVVLRNGPSEDVLEISDDGVGMRQSEPDEPRGLGMSHMKERARIVGAELTIESEPGEGTTVRLSMRRGGGDGGGGSVGAGFEGERGGGDG